LLAAKLCLQNEIDCTFGGDDAAKFLISINGDLAKDLLFLPGGNLNETAV
jgi:hypothetical protein